MEIATTEGPFGSRVKVMLSAKLAEAEPVSIVESGATCAEVLLAPTLPKVALAATVDTLPGDPELPVAVSDSGVEDGCGAKKSPPVAPKMPKVAALAGSAARAT